MLIFIKNTDINAEIDLPLSKSESNRALMILYYSKNLETWKPENLEISDSDDTVLLQHLLNIINEHSPLSPALASKSEIIELDCANAGTVLRFLMTAVGCDSRHTYLLTGCDRMKSRPVDSLVETLRNLGVSIEYKERESFPPLVVKGKTIVGGKMEVCAERSSQYASSLLLASPLWEKGIELTLAGNIASLPYIDMTINMMRICGIEVERDCRTIVVKPGKYQIENIRIEPDWSAASFWYEMSALSDTSNLVLKNLRLDSLQADSVAAKYFDYLGVKSMQSDNDLRLIKCSAVSENNLTFDFTSCPDLFPAVIATCAGLKKNAVFTGIKNLSIKESDRKNAMIEELKKINISFGLKSDDAIEMKCPETLPYFTEEKPIVFNNYCDHRIAMALSVLSLKIGAIEMDNSEVVSKSYPEFFRALNC